MKRSCYSLYKTFAGWMFVVFLTIQLAMGAPAAGAPPITGNPTVDETFAGIERASGWTDRALMLGMLVVVLLMCGYFLKMANDEIKRGRQTAETAAKNFTETVERLMKAHEDINRDAIKQITISNTTLADLTRSMEVSRTSTEKIVRTLERIEDEVMDSRHSRDRQDDRK